MCFSTAQYLDRHRSNIPSMPQEEVVELLSDGDQFFTSTQEAIPPEVHDTDVIDLDDGMHRVWEPVRKNFAMTQDKELIVIESSVEHGHMSSTVKDRHVNQSRVDEGSPLAGREEHKNQKQKSTRDADILDDILNFDLSDGNGDISLIRPKPRVKAAYLFVDQSIDMSSPMQIRQRETENNSNESPVRKTMEIVELLSSPLRSIDNQNQSDHDVDVEVSSRNLLLSSVGEDDVENEDNPHRREQRSIRARDLFALNTSSSIGEIMTTTRHIRPSITLRPHTILPSSSSSPHKSSPLKNRQSRKRESNPFVDKLDNNDEKSKRNTGSVPNNLHTKEAHLSQREKGIEVPSRSSMDRSLSEPSIILSTNPILRAREDTNDSILIDDDDSLDALLAQPGTIYKSVAATTARPAARTQTLDSTRVRTSRVERALVKEQKESARKSKKLYQELNKSRRTKYELLSEMVITLPIPVKKLFDDANLNIGEELKPIQMKTLPVFDELKSFMVQWDRKTNSKYNSTLDVFEPCSVYLHKEKMSCLIFEITAFIKKVERDPQGTSLICDIKSLGETVVIVIGFDTFMNKLKMADNREYTERVRRTMNSQNDGAETDSPMKRRKTKIKDPSTTLTIAEIESLIACLRINGIKIFPTKNVHETGMWLKSFTYTIASARYDVASRNLDLATIGTIKSGVSKTDTYEKMLLQFKRMSSLKAGRVIGAFGSVKDLSQHVSEGGTLNHLVGMGSVELELRRVFSTLDPNELLKD